MTLPRSTALRARSLSLCFDDVVVIDHLDLDVVGVVGVVGENGAGKSCLLHALFRLDSDLLVVLVQQGDERTDAVDAIDSGVAARFSVAADVSAARWPSLSHGQRRRALLAAAFSRRADVLLVDEPTNHLDDDARAALDDALDAFAGAVVIASHDRALLDRICSRTVVMHRGEHLVVDAGATIALSTFERFIEERRGQRRDAIRRVDESRRQLSHARASSSQAEHQRSTRTRSKGPRDHDAGTLGAQFRVDQAAKRLGRDVSVKRRALARAEDAVVDIVAAPRPLGRSFFVDHVLAKRPRIGGLHGALVVQGGERVLYPRVDLDIGRADRLRVAGENGTGKTTLLRAIADEDDVNVLLLPQELPDVCAPLAMLHALPREARGRTLQAVAALGVDPTRLLSTSRPSLGEAKKLGHNSNQSSMLCLISPEGRIPRDHRLRQVKALADRALAELSAEFDQMYSPFGRASVPPERLLKSMLLMALYSVRSERQFCEQLDYNLLFRWFLDMDV